MTAASPSPLADAMTAAEHHSKWPTWIQAPEVCSPGAGPDALAPALAWLESTTEQLGLQGKAQFAAHLCSDEALANIAHHARTASAEPAQMYLACGWTHTGFAIEIRDNGQAFDPTLAKPAEVASSLADMPIGGHGLRLMRSHLQAMYYRREADCNVLLLEVAR